MSTGPTSPSQLSEPPYFIAQDKLPQHVAIIMDGNGRWAKKRAMPRIFGHKKGAKTVTLMVESAACLNIKALTLFAFSSENWKRPQDEVSNLMDLFASVLKSERDRLHANGVKVKFIGDLSRFSAKLNDAIASLEELTFNNDKLNLNIAINYGGRWDIVEASKKIAHDVQVGNLDVNLINEDLFKTYLALNNDVDLLIRTGGEHRISNFLLYQSAYSELYISNTLWPDFSLIEFYTIIKEFASRERRFGMTSEQIGVVNGR